MKKRMMPMPFILASLVALFGCSDPSSVTPSNSSTTAEEIDLTSETVNFTGSTSVEKVSTALSDAWLETFDSANRPAVRHNHTGSGAAYSSVTDGTGDIGFASREFSSNEQGTGYQNGRICRDGIAVIVNSANELSNITVQQLRDIYVNPSAIETAEVSNTNFGTDYSSETPIDSWDDLGLSSTSRITPYTRDTTSGTRDGFCTKIGIEKAKGDDTLLVSTVGQATGNGDMISKVGSDTNGIGYCSLEGLSSQTAVKAVTVDGVAATEATIRDESYPLQRNFNYIFPTSDIANNSRSAVKMALIESFVAYMGSAEGASIIVGEGGILDSTSTTTYDSIVASASWAEILGLR